MLCIGNTVKIKPLLVKMSDIHEHSHHRQRDPANLSWPQSMEIANECQEHMLCFGCGIFILSVWKLLFQASYSQIPSGFQQFYTMFNT